MSETPEYIGRFPIVDTLGVGGMGVVYSAKDPDIGRLVAIKVLHSNGDEEALERFKNEARTIGEISHPNIVMLLEYGVDKRKPFLVMEYLAGQSLESWIKKTHKLEEHKSVLIDMCKALKFAHDKDILHRDLKPGNIQILPTGQAKLLDFGIASSKNNSLTATGYFIGTPQFLAPEILQSTKHTKTSDCYSLGLLAYTMLCGKNPFSGETFEATMTKQLTLQPALLHELNPKIPINLSNVINQYLDKNHENRPQTPKLLEDTLKQLTAASLKNEIVPNTNAHLSKSHKTTMILPSVSNHKKLRYLGFIVVFFVTIVVIISIYNKDMKTANNKVISASSLPKKSEDRANNIPAITKSVTAKDDDSNLSIIETENSGGLIPATTREQQATEKPKTKPVVKEDKQIAEKPKIKPVIIKKKIKPNPVIQAKEEPETRTNTKDSTQILNKPAEKNQTSDSFIKKEQAPKFNFPQLNIKANKIHIKELTNTEIPRGKTKKIIIELPTDVEIDLYKIFRGRSEVSQIKVRNVKKLTPNTVQLMLYAEPNTPLGDYSLFGIYQNKKTHPIILEITL